MHKKDINVVKGVLLNNTLNNYEKKVLLHSLNMLKDEELVNVTKENIIFRLKEVLNELHNADKTTLIEDRIKKEIDILDKILNYDLSDDDLIEVSFQVDCLCYDNDIKPKGTNTIIKYVQKIKRKV